MSDVSTTIIGTGLVKRYESGLFSRRKTCAVGGVDIAIHQGETYALVGESGSGKTTLGKLLLMLIHPSEGEITCKGVNITHKTHSELASFRKKMQIIPQHPEDAFNPRWKVSRSILEPYQIYHELSGSESKLETLLELLQQTGLDSDYANRYPHQLSGGELQRAAIARTIALEPDFIVCDEPTSMLDVSVQASIIHLLKEIQKKTRVAFLFITHDIRLARIMGDRIGVMYKGLIVEEGPDILNTPRHPYTRSLTKNMRSEIKSADDNQVSGCPWQSGCPKADDTCHYPPPLCSYNGTKIRCHHPEQMMEKV